jgi:hypothetical protein
MWVCRASSQTRGKAGHFSLGIKVSHVQDRIEDLGIVLLNLFKTRSLVLVFRSSSKPSMDKGL